MKAVPYLFAAGVAAVFYAMLYLGERQRVAAIRTLAARSGFHYLGTALPKSLTLGGTPFERLSNVWNVIDGEPRGIRIIAFDCQVGIGKGSWRRSVIAVQSDADLSSALAFNPDMRIDSAGVWKILYRPKASLNMRVAGLTPVDELGAYLNSVSAGQAR
jgi:hypothetical protein